MKMTITESEFHLQFHLMGRGDNFSQEARKLLFDYYEEMDPEYELDVIAISCFWTEYASLEEAKENYDVEDLEDLERNTTVLRNHDDGILVVLQY